MKHPMNSKQLSALLKMCYYSDYKVDRGSRWYHLYHMGYEPSTDTHTFKMSYSEGIDVEFHSRTHIPTIESEVLRYMYNHYMSK